MSRNLVREIVFNPLEEYGMELDSEEGKAFVDFLERGCELTLGEFLALSEEERRNLVVNFLEAEHGYTAIK